MKVQKLSDAELKILFSKHFPFPTTCGYYHLHDTDDGLPPGNRKIVQYFLLEGLGIAVPIDDARVNHFFGAAFSHGTSLAWYMDDENKLVLSNHKKKCGMILGWGWSGGSREYRLQRERRLVEAELTEVFGVEFRFG